MDFLPAAEAELLDQCRELVRECLPGAAERVSYNVPYFRLFRDVCFLWPGSVVWGKKPSYTGVRIGFVQGFLLNDRTGFLDRGNRKQVFWKDLIELTAQDESRLRDLLTDAERVDFELREGLRSG